jgi:hypothetical protein
MAVLGSNLGAERNLAHGGISSLFIRVLQRMVIICKFTWGGTNIFERRKASSRVGWPKGPRKQTY